MRRSGRLADARKIFALRRLQAAEALLQLQEADLAERRHAEAEACARGRLRQAALQWQTYLSEGLFRPDFAGTLAGAISQAQLSAEQAEAGRQHAHARCESARKAFGTARSIEEGAETLVRQARRRVQKAAEEREQRRLEDQSGLFGDPDI